MGADDPARGRVKPVPGCVSLSVMSERQHDDRLSHDHSRTGALAGVQYAADLAEGVRSGSRRQKRRALVMIVLFGLWVVLPLAIMTLMIAGAIR